MSLTERRTLAGLAMLSSEVVWEIAHKGHHAWFQRAVVTGDMMPGMAPTSRYIVNAEGLYADPGAAPKCAGCGKTPDAGELEVYDVLSTSPAKAWPPPPSTDGACWLCNVGDETVSGDPPMCAGCVNHTKRPRR